MEKSKYSFNFNTLIRELNKIDKVKIPKGYIKIDAKKNSKTSSEYKKSKQE